MWARLLLEGPKTTRPHVTQKLTQSTQNVTATLTSAQGDPHPPATPVRAIAVRLSACWGPQRAAPAPLTSRNGTGKGPAGPLPLWVTRGSSPGDGSVPQRPLRRPPLPAEGATHTQVGPLHSPSCDTGRPAETPFLAPPATAPNYCRDPLATALWLQRQKSRKFKAEAASHPETSLPGLPPRRPCQGAAVCLFVFRSSLKFLTLSLGCTGPNTEGLGHHHTLSTRR